MFTCASFIAAALVQWPRPDTSARPILPGLRIVLQEKDKISTDHVLSVLSSNGIVLYSFTGGLGFYYLSVAEFDKAKTLRLLRQMASPDVYWYAFEDKRFPGYARKVGYTRVTKQVLASTLACNLVPPVVLKYLASQRGHTSSTYWEYAPVAYMDGSALRVGYFVRQDGIDETIEELPTLDRSR